MHLSSSSAIFLPRVANLTHWPPRQVDNWCGGGGTDADAMTTRRSTKMTDDYGSGGKWSSVAVVVVDDAAAQTDFLDRQYL